MSKKESSPPVAGPRTAITKTILVNPLSKGSLGKTTFYEYLAAALDRNRVPWLAANMDARHKAFAERHPENVQNLFSEGALPVDEYLPVFTAARRSVCSVYMIDQRAQADRAFVDAARRTGFLRQAAGEGIAVVGVCVALDDLEYIRNLHQAVQDLSAEGVNRWVLVRHPHLARSVSFENTPARTLLAAHGAVTITVPWVSQVTMNLLSGLAVQEGGALSFLDATAHSLMNSGDGAMSCAELQDAMGRMERQFGTAAPVLFPEGVALPGTPEPAPTEDEDTAALQARKEAYAKAFFG